MAAARRGLGGAAGRHEGLRAAAAEPGPGPPEGLRAAAALPGPGAALRAPGGRGGGGRGRPSAPAAQRRHPVQGELARHRAQPGRYRAGPGGSHGRSARGGALSLPSHRGAWVGLLHRRREPGGWERIPGDSVLEAAWGGLGVKGMAEAGGCNEGLKWVSGSEGIVEGIGEDGGSGRDQECGWR